MRPHSMEANGSAAPAGSPFLEGQTATVASAMLMQRVTGSISAAGGNVISSETEQGGAQSKDGYLRVVATFEISHEALQRVLHDLEAGMPFLFVEQMIVQTPINPAESGRLRVRLGRIRTLARRKVMKPHLSSSWVMLLYLLVFGAVGFIGQERGSAEQAGSVASLPPAGAPPAMNLGGNPLWAVPLTSLAVTRSRPIFSPSRRPPPERDVAPYQLQSAPPTRPPFSLVGAIVADKDSIAILMDENAKAVVRLRQGESHLGWTVQLGASPRSDNKKRPRNRRS